VPILSVFFGIIVRMWHDDHPPPHVHVDYQGYIAAVSIETGEVMRGQLPPRVAAIVREWCLKHRDELQANWCRAERFEQLERIQGADYDD
jgi:hypothetical protein